MKIVLQISKKVINGELKINEEIVYNNIKASLERLTDKENVTIHINRKDIDIIESKKEEFFRTVRGLKNFKLIEENYLNPGDCVVETEYGFIDAVIDTQFEELERILLEEVK
jgi:flagellar assembly protein FliH